MDKDKPPQVMRAPYLDMGRGEKRRTVVSYSNLTSSLQTRISALDLTEHELLEMIVITVNKINIHLMAGSDLDLTEDDISWP